MQLHRVFPFVAGAKSGNPGSPEYLHRPQTQGRLDNTNDYDCWYLAAEPAGAIGEAFGNLGVWTEAMFETPFLPGGRRALGVYQVPDAMPFLNLDDAQSLVDRGLRPTQVIVRNLPATQNWALKIFREKDARGDRRWDGVRWWSFQRPQWTVYGLWGDPPKIMVIEDLDLTHPAVIDAAESLARPLP